MKNAGKSLYETCKEALRRGAKPEHLAPTLGLSEISVRRVQELILREAADACFDRDVEEIPCRHD